MTNLSGTCAIVGMGETVVGKRPDATTNSLHLEAIKACLDDAGIKASQVDGLLTNQPLNDSHRSYATKLSHMAGIDPLFATDLALGGATPIAMVQSAVMAIEAGMATTVVCVHARKRSTADPSPGHPIRRGDEHWEEPWGHFAAAGGHAFAAARHMHEFGTTIDQLAEIAVSTRYNASHNPDAYYQDPITRDDVHNSRMMATPLTKLHCCLRSDGGGAIVVTGADVARDCAHEPIWVLGTGQATSHTTMTDWDDFTESPAVVSGAQAFGEAGVRPAEIDCCQIYDAFTPMVLLSLEALGFCAKGEGGPFVADGRLRLGGALPTNTDGGGLSHCHPGMRAMFLLVEAVRQLRGVAHGRQVLDARTACVNGTGGWWSSAATAILARQ